MSGMRAFVMRTEGQDLIEYAAVVAIIVFAAIAAMNSLSSEINTSFSSIAQLLSASDLNQPKPKPQLSPEEEIRMEDCVHLVEGQLLFQPETSMKEGVTYQVFARMTRNPNVNIAKGLNSSDIRIETTKASCNVSMYLKSGEPDAFDIDPKADAPIQHLIEANSYTQWDWTVTPKRCGQHHLLLYVTPLLWVQGINQWGNEGFPQAPRLISVKIDYWYASKNLIVNYWAIWTVVLTALALPLLNKARVWAVAAWRARAEKGKTKGFLGLQKK